jgi:hypothetical protein
MTTTTNNGVQFPSGNTPLRSDEVVSRSALPVSGVGMVRGVIRSRLAATMTFEVVRNDRCLVRAHN